jgi:hypothetical protein
VKIRDKAAENHVEAMNHALILNELFDLRAELEEAGVAILAIDADHAE